MIYIVVTRGYRSTHQRVYRHLGRSKVRTITYDRLIASKRVPPATYIFSDIDRLSLPDRELAAIYYRALSERALPVLNDPARVKTRFALLRSLHEAGINDFNVYRAGETHKMVRFPVFLRRESGHGLPLSGLLETADDLVRAIESTVANGVPTDAILVIEYCAEPVERDLFRKLAMFRIGQVMVPHLCVHDDNWLVKYGKLGIATPALYDDELRIIRENPYSEALTRAFDIAQIDYGRADFGIVGGRVQIYEINTNPHLAPGGSHPSPQRMESQQLFWAKYIDALQALAGKPLSTRTVPIRDERLKRKQGLRGRLIRSRRAP